MGLIPGYATWRPEWISRHAFGPAWGTNALRSTASTRRICARRARVGPRDRRARSVVSRAGAVVSTSTATSRKPGPEPGLRRKQQRVANSNEDTNSDSHADAVEDAHSARLTNGDGKQDLDAAQHSHGYARTNQNPYTGSDADGDTQANQRAVPHGHGGPTKTRTPVMTRTATRRSTSGPSRTPTVTATSTRAATRTRTATVSASRTISVTPSRTVTRTPTRTPTSLAVGTATITATGSPTAGSSRTSTRTPSVTPSDSPTSTPTSTTPPLPLSAAFGSDQTKAWPPQAITYRATIRNQGGSAITAMQVYFLRGSPICSVNGTPVSSQIVNLAATDGHPGGPDEATCVGGFTVAAFDVANNNPLTNTLTLVVGETQMDFPAASVTLLDEAPTTATPTFSSTSTASATASETATRHIDFHFDRLVDGNFFQNTDRHRDQHEYGNVHGVRDEFHHADSNPNQISERDSNRDLDFDLQPLPDVAPGRAVAGRIHIRSRCFLAGSVGHLLREDPKSLFGRGQRYRSVL